MFKSKVLKYKLFPQVIQTTVLDKITNFPEDLSIVVGGDGKGFNSVPRKLLQPNNQVLKIDTNESESYTPVLKIRIQYLGPRIAELNYARSLRGNGRN